jgi:hypothetical protein
MKRQNFLIGLWNKNVLAWGQNSGNEFSDFKEEMLEDLSYFSAAGSRPI